MVEYTPGYLADHWCQKGHVLLVLEGELHTELADGRTVVLKPGQSYQVADGDLAHRSQDGRWAPNSSSWTDMATRSDSSASAPWASRCAATSRRRAACNVLAADRDQAPLKRLAADGVKAASLDEIVANCRTIFLSLPGGKEVEQVCLGEGGILSKVADGLDDRSTAAPRRSSLARRLYAEFEGKACGLRRRAGRAHAAGRDRRHAVDHGRRHGRDVRPHRAAAAPHGERGDALRRGGRGPGGQDPEQHDPVPDRRGAGRGAHASRAPTASTARCCSRP